MESREHEVADSPTDYNVQTKGEELLNQRIANRKGKLSFCTRKQNELKRVMQDGSVAAIDKGIQDLMDALNELDKAHVLVQDMLTGDNRQDDHVQWYEPKKKSLSFLENAQMFKGHLSQPLPVITPLDSVSNTSRQTKRSSQSNASSLSKVQRLKQRRQLFVNVLLYLRRNMPLSCKRRRFKVK